MKKQIRAKRFLRGIALTLFAALTLGSAGMVSASEVQTTPYDTYGYFNLVDVRYWSTRPMYTYKTTITGGSLGISSFYEPNDVFVADNGQIYIADTKNGRVLVLDESYKLVRTIEGLTYEGEEIDITGALGVFATPEGRVYIADSENKRVVVCNEKNEVVQIIGAPADDVVPADFLYRPKRVVVDSTGLVYVVSDGSYYGAVLFDANGNFLKFFGSNAVQGSFTQVLERIKKTIFRNDAKLAAATKQLPYQFSDLALDAEGFVYTVTGAFNSWESPIGQLRKLSPGGTNILLDKSGFDASASDGVQFSDVKSVRGIGGIRLNNMQSLDVDENGFMYVVEATYGRIYVYDQECNQITVFGGGMGKGTQQGTFNNPTSLALDSDGDVYVCDNRAGSVTVYERTDYGNLFLEAQTATLEGDFDVAKPLWEQVVQMDRNHPLIYKGMARAAVFQENFEEALDYARMGYDSKSYATAFSHVRNDWLSVNFYWVFIGAILLIGGLVALFVVKRKKAWRWVRNENVAVMFSTITHPFASFQKIKYQKMGSVWFGAGILLVWFITNLLSNLWGGFSFGFIDVEGFDALMLFLSSVGAILLWTVCNWGSAILFNGKGTMKQVFLVSCVSMIPQIIGSLSYLVLSNVLIPEEALPLTIIAAACNILSLVILCIGTIVVHDFGFFKFLGIAVITIIAMLISLFVIFMVGILIQQFWTFLVTLFQEVRYR